MATKGTKQTLVEGANSARPVAKAMPLPRTQGRSAAGSKATTFETPARPSWALQDEFLADGDSRTKAKHDVDEIVYGHSFRKLAQKTQVVTQPRDETFRTRNSHTLEVAQIADNFCDLLHLNEDATRAIAFGHDLGHPPFAHIGEMTLQRILKDYVKKTLRNIVGKRDGEEEILKAFEFTHSANSRRILLRKTNGVTDTTLLSVVGHSWSPWSSANTCGSLPEVGALLTKPLEGTTRTFLPCYEAQAVALSDQIAGLNSDIEDLINIHKGDAAPLRTTAHDLLDILTISKGEKEEVSGFLNQWVVAEHGSEAQSARRGWGRKQRFQAIISSIYDRSLKAVESCNSSTEAYKAPLKPAPAIAVALNVLERATRRMVYTEPMIRVKDSLAEAAVSVMFHRLLTYAFLASSGEGWVDDARKETESESDKHLLADYVKWKKDYYSEVKNEDEKRVIEGAFSWAGMKHAVSFRDDLWPRIQPAVETVDYISEMTDRFVIYTVFQGHPLQVALVKNFDAGPAYDKAD
ncbi:MAG: HD domain-containing protein [Verrucomicrobiia bacterium]